jgi:hypothetical protein
VQKSPPGAELSSGSRNPLEADQTSFDVAIRIYPDRSGRCHLVTFRKGLDQEMLKKLKEEVKKE